MVLSVLLLGSTRSLMALVFLPARHKVTGVQTRLFEDAYSGFGEEERLPSGRWRSLRTTRLGSGDSDWLLDDSEELSLGVAFRRGGDGVLWRSFFSADLLLLRRPEQ